MMCRVERVTVVAVHVGRPLPLVRRRGRQVHSAIAKQPVTGPTIHVGKTNLAGDQQADLRVHGGVDKAVYAYPSEHLDAWRRALDRPLGLGAFGENLSLAGATEGQVRIGDVWAWGDALVQVSQPRSPCFKLAAHLDRPQVARMMIASGRTGWYLRVLQPGEAPVTGVLRLVERDPAAPSVLDAHRALFAGRDGV